MASSSALTPYQSKESILSRLEELKEEGSESQELIKYYTLTSLLRQTGRYISEKSDSIIDGETWLTLDQFLEIATLIKERSYASDDVLSWALKDKTLISDSYVEALIKAKICPSFYQNLFIIPYNDCHFGDKQIQASKAYLLFLHRCVSHNLDGENDFQNHVRYTGQLERLRKLCLDHIECNPDTYHRYADVLLDYIFLRAHMEASFFYSDGGYVVSGRTRTLIDQIYTEQNEKAKKDEIWYLSRRHLFYLMILQLCLDAARMAEEGMPYLEHSALFQAHHKGKPFTPLKPMTHAEKEIRATNFIFAPRHIPTFVTSHPKTSILYFAISHRYLKLAYKCFSYGDHYIFRANEPIEVEEDVYKTPIQIIREMDLVAPTTQKDPTYKEMMEFKAEVEEETKSDQPPETRESKFGWRGILLAILHNYSTVSEEEEEWLASLSPPILLKDRPFSKNWLKKMPDIDPMPHLSEAMDRDVTNKYLKHLILHPKFRASRVGEEMVDKALDMDFGSGDEAKDDKKEFLTSFLQTGVVCSAAQVRKLNELGIDHYKVTQAHVSDMEDRFYAMEEKLEAMVKAKEEEDRRYEAMHHEVVRGSEFRIQLLSLLQTTFDRLPPEVRPALPSFETLQIAN